MQTYSNKPMCKDNFEHFITIEGREQRIEIIEGIELKFNMLTRKQNEALDELAKQTQELDLGY